MTPNPLVPPPPPPNGNGNIAPSNSTNATLLGGALATIFMIISARYGLTFPAGGESALSVIFAALCGYLPKSGRRG